MEFSHVPRGKIQEESMYYSVFDQGGKKHDGVDTLLSASSAEDHGGEIATEIELIRSPKTRMASRSPT